MIRFPLARLIGLCALALGLSPLTTAQEGSTITEDSQFDDWLVRCITEGDKPRECAMISRAIDVVDQRDLAIIRFLRVPEEARVLGNEIYAGQLTVPTNINVRAGIDVLIDQTFVGNVDFEVCTPRNCITTFPLTPEMIQAMRAGFAGTLVLTDAAGFEVSASFSLSGFSTALDML